MPVNDNEPLVSVERSRKTDAPITAERRETDSRYWRDDRRESSDRFETKGPAEYRERTDVYLRPGQYDEAWAKSLDYQAVENILTDWLACGGQVELMSPMMARGKLTEDQIKDLQSGRPRVMSEIARQLDADILVQVQAHPTHQTPQGLTVRVVSEAISLKGGQSIGRAMVDITLPLEKTTINRFTRFLASKLMDDMAGAWMTPGPGTGTGAGPAPAPTPRDRRPMENPPTRSVVPERPIEPTPPAEPQSPRTVNPPEVEVRPPLPQPPMPVLPPPPASQP